MTQNLDQNTFIKFLIKNYESHILSYGEMLKDVSINRKDYIKVLGEEFTDWHKNNCREELNECKSWLKDLVKEQTYLNQGLNPPYCYPY
jgi:Mn-containing catalase